MRLAEAGQQRSIVSRLPPSRDRGLDRHIEEHAMLDAVLILGSIGFFAVSWSYVHACDRL
jgi:hypothetical protein